MSKATDTADTAGASIDPRAAMLGVVAGMRSQLPVALLALAAGGREPGGWLASPAARIVLAVVAAGELIGDKLPTAPSRLEPLPLLGRVAFGAVAGGLLSTRLGGEAMPGVGAGATGAVVGTIAFGEARLALTRLTGLPDVVFAVAEDALAVGLGLAAVRGSVR